MQMFAPAPPHGVAFQPPPAVVQEPLVPAPRPPEEREASKIDKFVHYLVQSEKEGKDAEREIRQREAGNKEFEFLSGGPHYRYFKWMLACARIGYTANQRYSILLAYREAIAQCKPGYLDLTHEQSNELSAMLDANRGTEADVKNIRRWIVNHSHCAVAIGIIMRRAVLQYVRAHSAEESFGRVLFTAYVLNDIFFNAEHVETHDASGFGDPKRPVDIISCMIDQVAPIVIAGSHIAPSHTHRTKLLQLPQLWLDSKLLQPATYDRCFGSAQLNSPPTGEPPIPPLTSPYVQNLPPPHNAQPPPPPSQPPVRPPPPLAPLTPRLQLGDLTTTSVGVMADVVRQVMRSGHKRYRPINLDTFHFQPPSPMSSSRLQEKLEDFLRFVEDVDDGTSSHKRKSGHVDYR